MKKVVSVLICCFCLCWAGIGENGRNAAAAGAAAAAELPVAANDDGRPARVTAAHGFVQLDLTKQEDVKGFVRHKTELARFGVGCVLSVLAVFVFNFLIGRLVRFCCNRSGNNDLLVRLIVRGLFWPIGLCVFATGMRYSFEQLTFVDPENILAAKISGFFVVLSVIWALFSLGNSMCRYGETRARAKNNMMGFLLITMVRRGINVISFAILLLFILKDVLDININAILASAGVAGLAIAFAAQSTIANFFGSVMILIDHPFTVGDRVKINAVDGVVEAVGFRSTRIRSLDGNLYTLPNSTVADAVVENVTERPFIKYAFDIGLVYSTSAAQMRKACALLDEIFKRHPGFYTEKHPPVIRFTEFRDWSLNIAVVVWYDPADWGQFLIEREAVNLEILERFNAEKLEFAFPSTTNYLQQG